MQSNLYRIASEFAITPAEAAVLITVHYEIPIPKDRFVPHAVWEVAEEVDEDQVWQAFDDCLSKGWITLDEYDRPEFTTEGKTLWSGIRDPLTRWGVEWRASQDDK